MEFGFLQSLTETIMAAEREGAELILHAGTVGAHSKTGRRDVVTEYDRKVQELLVERLRAAVPGAGFVMEESDAQDAIDREHVFIIDPIDGTMNFVHHYNHSAISVAYASFGQVLCACVYDPYADEMFSAVKGQGAFLNGQPIHADPAPLNESLFCLGSSPYYPDLTDETFRLARIAFDNSLDLRRLASAELDLCAIAAGRAGLYFELRLSLWDYAAGMLLVNEAGGVILSIDGSPLRFGIEKTSVLAGGKQAVADFLALTGGKGA